MKTWFWAIGLGLFVVFLILYFSLNTAGVFTGPAASWTDYGEPPQGGALVKQPISFWTDLAFVIAGLAALVIVDTQKKPHAYLPMRSASPYSVGLGLIMVWMGPGSMLEHGLLLTNWGWADAASIHWFTIFVILYLLMRCVSLTIDVFAGPSHRSLQHGSARRVVEAIVFYVIYFAACALVGALTWDSVPRKDVSIGLMAATGVVYLLAMVPTWVRWAANDRVVWDFVPHFETPWHLIPVICTLVLFGTALVFLFTSAEGGSTAPGGHGVFHVCVASVAFCIFLTLFLEQDKASIRK